MAAVPHDVVEDTSVTAVYLLAEVCPRDVVEAVPALTRSPSESCEAFSGGCSRIQLPGK
jgi:hypothetical protein